MQVGGFLLVFWFYSTNKTDGHNMGEILLTLSDVKHAYINPIVVTTF